MIINHKFNTEEDVYFMLHEQGEEITTGLNGKAEKIIALIAMRMYADKDVKEIITRAYEAYTTITGEKDEQ